MFIIKFQHPGKAYYLAKWEGDPRQDPKPQGGPHRYYKKEYEASVEPVGA